MATNPLRHVVVGLFVFAIATVPAPQADENLLYGKTGVLAAARTDAGNWQGTWYFVSKDRTMAIWMLEQEGEVKLKLQLRNKGVRGQSFITDWDGRAEYNTGGIPGTFALEIDHKDENTISGRWVWDYGLPSNNVSERAEFTVYRGGYGRQMVWMFKDFHNTYRGRQDYETHTDKTAWTFVKASRHQALWNELPF